jgi:glycerol uptake operon antiterminator
MQVQDMGSIFAVLAQHKIIPIVENRSQLQLTLKGGKVHMLFLRHCNVLELEPLLQQAALAGHIIYVSVEHMNGVHPDAAGLQYLKNHLYISGIISTNARTLALGHTLGLQTMLHVFAADSAGLESVVETLRTTHIDLVEVSPALVIPHIASDLHRLFSVPVIGSGLVATRKQINAILNTGISGVAITIDETKTELLTLY